MRSKKTTFYSLLFTVFVLTYLVTLSVTDGYAKELDVPSTIFFHYAPGFTRIAGFVSFWLIRRIIKSENGRRIQLICAATLFLVSSFTLMLMSGKGAILTALFILSLSVGHLGGLIYYCVAISFATSPLKGRMIGMSCAASVILQYILTGNRSNLTQLIIATVLFVLISYMLIRTPADYVLEDPLPYAGNSAKYSHDVKMQLILIISVIVICLLLACRTDVAFVSMSFDGSVNIYSYPRLAMIPGYLLMGFAADHKNPKYFTMTFICALVLSAVLVLMPFQNSGYAFFLSIYYFFISAYIFFYTYTLISVAPRTGKPELWASLGRPLSDLCVTLISSVMLSLGDERLNSSPIYYALYYFTLLIVLYIVITVINIDPNLSGERSKDTGDSPSFDDRMTTYSLTPRETDVARLLIETDYPIKGIATDLGISERSVYRYASSIYEKTGTENRTGLIRLYNS